LAFFKPGEKNFPSRIEVEPMDRISSTQRPRDRVVMYQKWRHLMFLHWAVAPATLRPLVPKELEVDLFEGRAYVGLIPFTVKGVRPTGLPAVPALSNFHETNVRTYVHFQGRDPGVWFFSLDAANRIAVGLARRFFHLPYHHARMFLECEHPDRPADAHSLLYAGARRWPETLSASYLIRGAASGPVEPARLGTLEHFLVERYLLYAFAHGRVFQGRVHHRPYPLQPANVLSLDETLLAAAGLERPLEPALAHFAAGVDVEILPLRQA
jgi:uncharacterized protein YqjF (DUF2071 family)